jgi:hypothetical protein
MKLWNKFIKSSYRIPQVFFPVILLTLSSGLAAVEDTSLLAQELINAMSRAQPGVEL